MRLCGICHSDNYYAKGLCKTCYMRQWAVHHPARKVGHQRSEREKATRRLTQLPKYRALVLREFDMLLDAYGRSCACCGEETREFLTLDHLNGLTEEDRKLPRGGYNLYRKLRYAGYPKGRFQILCFNCNCTKGMRGGCPHQKTTYSSPEEQIIKRVFNPLYTA